MSNFFRAMFLVPICTFSPSYAEVASKDYVDRQIAGSQKVNTGVLANEVKSKFISNADAGDEAWVEMDGLMFIVRKASTKNHWSIRVKNNTKAPLSLSFTFSQLYGAYQGRNSTAIDLAAGEEHNPDTESGDIGYGRSDTAISYVFNLTEGYLYRFIVTVHIEKAAIVVEKLT